MGLAAEYCRSLQLVPGRERTSMPPPAQPVSQPLPRADVSERAVAVLVESGRVLPRQGHRWSHVWPQAAGLGVGNQGSALTLLRLSH